MPKTVRFNFNKGIYGGLEPRIVGDGFASVIHNVDQRSGISKPAKAPVLDGSISAAGGSKWMWEFLGTWYFSPEIRNWAGEKVGTMTRVYYTIPGQSAIPPQKIVDGVQAKLGTKPPTTAPGVKAYTSVDSSIITLSSKIDTVASAGLKKAATYRYRLAGMDASGTVVATSNTVQATVTYADTEAPHLTWTAPGGLSNIEIYRSDAGDLSSAGLFYIAGTAPGVGSWVDSSMNSLDFSKTFPVQDTEKIPYKYLFTYLRDVNGHVDESGPSPISEATEGPNGRVITFEATGTGTFVGSGSPLINPVATPIAGTAVSTVRSMISSGGVTTIATQADHGLSTSSLVRMTSTHAGDSEKVGMYTVTVPVSPGRPLGVSILVRPSSGGSISPGTHTFKLVGVRGWSLAQVGARTYSPGAYGGMTLPSSGNTVTIASGDSITVTVQPMDVDAYYLYMDDVLVWAWDAYEMEKAGYWTGSSLVWTNKPSLPTTDTSSSRVYKINATLEPISSRSFPTGLPAFDTGGGVTITTAAHGVTVGAKRSVQLDGFSAPNTSLNAVWVAEATSSTAVKIKTAMTGSSSTGTSAIFAKLDSGSTTDETSNIKARRLYRIGDVTDFLRVAEIDISETSYTDNVKTVDLGPACPSFYTSNGLDVVFAPPPDGLSGIVASNGVLGGLDGHKFRWTPANYPDAWPEVFFVQAHYPVKAIPIGGSWIIFCAGKIGRLEMGSPTQTFFQWLPVETGCVAPHSIQATPKGIVFLGQDGLCLFDVGSNQVVNLFPDRLTRRFFLAPSKPTTAYGHWWVPANKTFAYTFLTRDMAGSKRAGMVSHLDDQPTWPEEWTAPRSFYTNGRYYLYYWDDQTSYKLHGMLEVSLEGQQPVARLIGLRPMASHVTAVGNAYLMLPGSSGTLDAVLDLEGAAPDTDTGAGALNIATPAVYRFGDELGTASSMCIRTGPMNAALHERAFWKEVSFHGKGTGTVKIWLDDWDITAGGAAQFVASETTTKARTVKIPRGASGYSLDLEISGDLELLACEVTFDPMPSEG